MGKIFDCFESVFEVINRILNKAFKKKLKCRNKHVVTDMLIQFNLGKCLINFCVPDF